jgi:CHAT domain-containing protein
MARRILWIAGLLAVACLLRWETPTPAERSEGQPPPIPHLRLIESPATEDTIPPDLREISRAANRTEREISRGESSPEALRTLGGLWLTKGRFQDAVLTLEGSVLQNPAATDSLSDLAAAYLARGEKEGQPFDFVLALNAADRALAEQPGLPEALFNRAEALTRLQLTRQATEAWDAYLSIDPSSDWAADAKRHHRELQEPTFEELWERELHQLQTALVRNDSKTVGKTVSLVPDLARRYAEEQLLPTWAENRSLPGGLDPLSAARQIGAALRDQAGDVMIFDAVAAIERAGKAESRLSALRRGHLLFRQAQQRYNDRNFQEARPLMVAAGEALAAGGSPFGSWTDLYIGICDYYSAPMAAHPRFLRLVRSAITSRYPALAGRADWMLGTIAAIRNRPEDSLTWSHSAIDRLARSSGPQASAIPYIQMATAFQNLGQPSSAWEARLEGLAALRRSGDRRHLLAALSQTAGDLLEQKQAGPALAFADELLANATGLGLPDPLAEARLRRGQALAGLGRVPEALEEIRAGRQDAAGIQTSGGRQRVLSNFDLFEADLLADREPAEAARLAGRSLTSGVESGFLYLTPSLLAVRARAYRNLGDILREEADLLRAIEEHERIRETVRDEGLRLTVFEQVQSVFDEMVRLQVDSHGDVQEALTFAERSRSRLLLDLIAGGKQRLPEALPADRILAELPEGVTLVEYLVLPDRLLAWVGRRGVVELVQTEISQKELERAISSLRSAVERRASIPEIQQAAAALHTSLVRPLESLLPEGSPLVFVPDRSLVQVPFAALFDPGRRRYLIEDHPVALAPSATLYLAALERRSRLEPAVADAFVVGDPAFDQTLNPRLRRLPDADAEASDVANLLPRSDVLRGKNATRRAFLTGAPGHRIVHFAGHALLHPTSPELSRLIFAPEGEDRGILYARDLASYRLEGTELVVLSACRTLDGAGASRESLVGLTAAFLAAGPPVVVSSLWRVNDQVTRQLMLAFYRSLRGGGDPALALQAAQRQLLDGSDEQLRSPSAWAGFETFGGVFFPEN